MPNTKQTKSTLSWLAVGSALALAACGEPTARVNIDLSQLEAQAAALGMPLNQVRVRVSPDTTIPSQEQRKEFEVSVSEMSFELDITAGSWLFEAVGERTNADPPVPTYFGDVRVQLEPLADVDLLVPMFPAGKLDVEVVVPEDSDLSDALIRFVPLNPRPDQSTFYAAPFVAGELSRILPTGNYEVFGEVTFDGTNFVAVGPELRVLIQHGVVHAEAFVIE